MFGLVSELGVAGRERSGREWRVWGEALPMYQPRARTIRRAKIRSNAPVPAHRYVTYGVDLSR